MRPTSDLHHTLRDALPADLHAAIPALAAILDAVATGTRSPSEAESDLVARPELAAAPRALDGRPIMAGSALISFGVGAQIGDVAGGSMVKLHVDRRQGAFVSGGTIHGDVIGQQTMVPFGSRKVLSPIGPMYFIPRGRP